MFGVFSKLFQRSKSPLSHLAKSITDKHKKTLAQVILEARLLGVLNHPNDSEELKRYYQLLADRYNEVMALLHKEAHTHETILAMRQLAKGVNRQTDPRLVKRLRYRFLEYFEYMGQIKELEHSIIKYYVEAIEVFQTNNLKLRSQDDISEYFYQVPIPLNTLFSSL